MHIHVYMLDVIFYINMYVCIHIYVCKVLRRTKRTVLLGLKLVRYALLLLSGRYMYIVHARGYSARLERAARCPHRSESRARFCLSQSRGTAVATCGLDTRILTVYHGFCCFA